MRLLAAPAVLIGVLCGVSCGAVALSACDAGGDAPAAGKVPEASAPAVDPRLDAFAATRDQRRGESLAEALAVLRAWDVRRARAWAAQDTHALQALYLPRSVAGAADVRLLRAYERRRLVVRRLETQVFAARVLHRSPRRLRLLVHDRVAGGTVRSVEGVSSLRSSEPKQRVLELQRVSGEWLMGAVTERG